MPDPKIIRSSAVTGEGIDDWLTWLDTCRTSMPQPAKAG